MTCKGVISAVFAGLILAGCGVSPARYDAYQEGDRGSPAMRNQSVNQCVQNFSAKPLRTRQQVATLMNTSVRSAPRLFCQRLVRGIASGRLSREDVNAGMRGQVTPGIVRVIQGR